MTTQLTADSHPEGRLSTVAILADPVLRYTNTPLPDEGCMTALPYALLEQERDTLLSQLWLRFGRDDTEPAMEVSFAMSNALTAAGLDPDDLTCQPARLIWAIIGPAYRRTVEALNTMMVARQRDGTLKDWLDMAA